MSLVNLLFSVIDVQHTDIALIVSGLLFLRTSNTTVVLLPTEISLYDSRIRIGCYHAFIFRQLNHRQEGCVLSHQNFVGHDSFVAQYCSNLLLCYFLASIGPSLTKVFGLLDYLVSQLQLLNQPFLVVYKEACFAVLHFKLVILLHALSLHLVRNLKHRKDLPVVTR